MRLPLAMAMAHAMSALAMSALATSALAMSALAMSAPATRTDAGSDSRSCTSLISGIAA
jgi:hypothetical protein